MKLLLDTHIFLWGVFFRYSWPGNNGLHGKSEDQTRETAWQIRSINHGWQFLCSKGSGPGPRRARELGW